MLDLITCFKSFVRTVETGSFSAVARETETTQPTISKQIAALEAYLDVQLLVRSTRKVSLTEEGMRFYEHCQHVLESLAEAESSVGKRRNPSGVLRVNCPIAFGQMKLLPRLKLFLDSYPEIKVDLTMADHFIDLVEEGIDLAIRIGHHDDRNLITQPIGTTRLVTIAVVSYLQQFGEPQTPADLLHHNCVVYTRQSTLNDWQFRGTSVRVSGNLLVNNSTALREAILAGVGIGICPILVFENELRQQSLKVILADYELEPLPIQVVSRRGRFQPAKVKCFIDFLASEFQSGSAC